MSEPPKHLLIVDDEKALREAIAERLADHGFVVEQAASGEEALARLADFAFDILITDLRLPGIDGRQVLDAALERYPDIIAIVITGYGTVKDAVDAIKQGAADFITKPFQFDALLHVLSSAIEQRRLKSENAYLRSQLEERYRIDGLVGRSAVMRDLFQLLETVAATSSTVLITGETGTGKELAARPSITTARGAATFRRDQLQRDSGNAARGASCSATCAARSPARSPTRQGRLEQAHKGTLFLDEVGTMSPALQAKLLRVLQEREFERVGDSHTIKIDVRVIAATHSDLARMVAEGTFREDLFYRLNVIPVQLPPLRERRDDIPLLVQHFLQKLSADLGRGPATVSQEAHAPADGLSLARQRPAARERRRARAGVQPGPRRRSTSRISRRRSSARPPRRADRSRAFPDEGIDFERYIVGRRAGADQALARAHARQQAPGGEAAEPEAHDADRKAEAARAAQQPTST